MIEQPQKPLLSLRPTPAMLPALRQLWRSIFDDPEAIVDLVFQRLVRPETARVLADSQGQPLSMLFLQPVKLHLAGEPLEGLQPDCAYIYGVATRPDQRGLGLSSRLLQETAQELASQARALTLVPSGPQLVGYYARLGFGNAFSHRLIQLTADQLEKPAPGGSSCQLHTRRLAELAGLRNRSLLHSPLALLWDEDFLEMINEECCLYQGEVLHFASPAAEGYLVYYRDEGGVLIKEYLELPNPGQASPLPQVLAALHQRLGAARYTLRLRPDLAGPALPEQGEIVPFGMLRALPGAPAGLLDLFGQSDQSGQSDRADQSDRAEQLGRGYLAHALD